MKATIEQIYQRFLESTSVTTDSRNCPEGSMFIALKGSSFNGNTFAGSALEKGCAFAVVDEESYEVKGDDRYLLTDDCLQSLQALASLHRERLGTTILGITGTNGKTTTKELTAAVLGKKFNILYTQGNLNNHIGVPLTLLNLRKEHQVAIIEMGASHPGDINELVQICKPDYGLITNVGKAHLQGFGSFEGVIRTKCELYDFLRNRTPKGKVFLNQGNAILTGQANDLECLTYGKDGAGVSGRLISCSPFLKVGWRQQGSPTEWTIQTRLIGAYNLENVLAAIRVGIHFQVPEADIVSAIEAYSPSNSRSELRETGYNTLIVDAYNANPTSMRAAIDNFHLMDARNKMLILGGMRELGEDSQKEHETIIHLLESYKMDDVILVGEEFMPWSQQFKVYINRDALAEDLSKTRPEGKTILLKGSNSVGLGKIAEML